MEKMIIAKRSDGALLVKVNDTEGFIATPATHTESAVMDIYSLLAHGEWQEIDPITYKK